MDVVGSKPVALICLMTGNVCVRGGNPPNMTPDGREHMWVPVVDAEPYYTQRVGSDSESTDRTQDGRFDKTHLSPEHAYRIGRDYLAHCIRYGWPMKVVKERLGAGARIIEFGCGKELPLFRTLTCDHSAVTHYKPKRYVGMDLNKVKYNPRVTGIDSLVMSEMNCVENFAAIPDEVFDLTISFEVVEHMDKPDGLRFLDSMVRVARRKSEREGKPGLLLLSTPVNGGKIAKNHVYEYGRGELRRAIEKLGCTIEEEYGTFSNIRDLVGALSVHEEYVWNQLAKYHSPDVLTALFSCNHPEVARNIAWLVNVP